MHQLIETNTRKKYTNRFVSICFLYLILLLQAHIAIAAEKLRIVTEDWKPFSYLDNNHQVIGSTAEKVKQVMALTGLQYTIEIMPWARAYKIATSEPNVLIYSIFNAKERLGKFHFLCPLVDIEPQYFYKLRARKDIRLKTLDDAKNYRIGILREDYDHVYLKSRGFKDGINLDTNSLEEGNIKKLFKGRIDLVINSEQSIQTEIEKLALDKTEVVQLLKLPYSDEVQNCMALSLGTNESIVSKVRQALYKVNSSKFKN